MKISAEDDNLDNNVNDEDDPVMTEMMITTTKIDDNDNYDGDNKYDNYYARDDYAVHK